ncbi:MAG: GNAT family N-acetyltransferase [Bacteroidales bacterium]|jgi:hypothetical protein|nr:GNAT family N-acetyltransferase [Bacteroidales bacterium]
MRCIRLKNKQDLFALEKLNSLKGQNILKNYPLHKRWMDRAIKEIQYGNRIAFGVFQQEELIGSVIMKFGFSQELELKNFIVKTDDSDSEMQPDTIRLKILEQVNKFCQKNRFEKCVIDIITNDLNEINFFLKTGFKVVHLKESSYKSNQNTYSLLKQVEPVYNDDPLDFLKMVNWILEYKYSFQNISSPVGTNFEDCSRIFDSISFELDNNRISKEYAISGEAIVDIDSMSKIPEKYYDELTGLYSKDAEIKLLFSQANNSKVQSYGIKEFSYSDILKLLGEDNNVSKIPFDCYETGGLFYFVDERFINMIERCQGELFNVSSFILYLVDGLGASLKVGQTIFFCKYNTFTQKLTLMGFSNIEAICSHAYSKILTDFREDTQFIKETFGDFYDPYEKEDWNFYTSFLQSVSSENLLRNDMTAVRLEPISLLKNECEILPSLDLEVQNYVSDSLKELIIESIYIDKRSANNILQNIDIINSSRNSFKNDLTLTPKVFISYSHKDKDFADMIKNIIESEGFDVIIDINDLQTGTEVKDFINKSIKESDITLTIISKNSISSSWVAIETLTSLYTNNIVGRKLFPCVYDQELFKSDFVDEMYDVLDLKIDELITRIGKRNAKKRPAVDLDNEKNRLQALHGNLASIVDNIRNMGCIDFYTDFENAKDKLIKDLRNTSR